MKIKNATLAHLLLQVDDQEQWLHHLHSLFLNPDPISYSSAHTGMQMPSIDNMYQIRNHWKQIHDKFLSILDL